MNRLIRQFIDQQTYVNKVGVVVGAGKSGLAAARLLGVLGAQVRIVDRNQDLTQEDLGTLAGHVELITGQHKNEHFSDAEIIVLSPGVPVFKMAEALKGIAANKIVSELEFASWFIEEPVIAITGTNGKTTTTTLVSTLLEQAGRTVFTGGNIGTPLCDYVLEKEPAEIIILEVSSFQLQNCHTFKPTVGIFLNFAPDHLDYHVDMDEYLDAKLRLFSHMTQNDTVLVHESLHDLVDERRLGQAEMTWFGPSTCFDVPYLPGEHNLSNVAAAWQAVKLFDVTETQAAATLRHFKALPNRIEPVAEKNGILYVNDSKATTLDAVVAAVKTYDRPIRLLMGGVWKGGDVVAFAQDIKDKVTHIGLFGASREIFEKPLQTVFPTSWDPTLEEAVARLTMEAHEGDVILLSPATASFDQYANYVARGNDFKRIVEALP